MVDRFTRSDLAAWVTAARLHTLPAAAAPVIVGTGIAIHHDVFALLPALFALISATLIQIGTNFANDYYDGIKGVDAQQSAGFTRVTESGIVRPETMKRATIVTFGTAILTGTYLVYVGGLPILIIGLISVICGWAYTGGPYPLGYHGLGDLFVFVFFGLIGVTGTYYVQAITAITSPLSTEVHAAAVAPEAVLGGIAIGALATAILVVNNIRDLSDDAKAGKRTLAVRLGYRASRVEYTLLIAAAYLIPFVFVGIFDGTMLALLPVLTVPYGLKVLHSVLTRIDGDGLNPALEATGKLLVSYSVLFAIGVGLS